MRLAVLWSALSGYMKASIEALPPDVEVDVLSLRVGGDTEFDPAAITPRNARSIVTDEVGLAGAVDDLLGGRSHDAVLVNGWNRPAYREAARGSRQARRVLFFDNPWIGSGRQRLGLLPLRAMRARSWDAAFVPGDRQRDYARRLGFRDESIRTGGYCADTASFARVEPSDSGFLFVGRLVREKGVGELAEAYARYRQAVERPWPLTFHGVGPLRGLLLDAGATDGGFVQPQDLPEMMSRHAALVLPSHRDHWGLVVQEAAAAGLAVVATSTAHASERFVDDATTGRVIPPRDVDALLAALLDESAQPVSALRAQQAASRQLGLSYTPADWASTLLELL